MDKPSVRERLSGAAFALFDEIGYEQATVDDIAERAGLGRTTFFRHYRSKEDVIFPDHDRMLQQVRGRLQASSGHGGALPAVSDAVRTVLLHYLREGDLARRRYALTSTVPALRDREIASVARYQRLLREFIAGSMADTTEASSLRAELMAASAVAAHNHVLRRWLRGESSDPVRELDDAMREVSGLFTRPGEKARHSGTTIVAFHSGEDIETLIAALRQEELIARAEPDVQPGDRAAPSAGSRDPGPTLLIFITFPLASILPRDLYAPELLGSLQQNPLCARAQSGNRRSSDMAYVIALPCVDLLDKTCIDECPVDCIYEGERMMYIHPDECVDCGACEPVCPVEAISFVADTPAEWKVFHSVNAEFFDDLGSPGGAAAVGKIHKDHPLVAGLPPQR
jgi:AcrR family transcriptional regulator/NAD-dependent dihydropyrimidine dehydrogenase PreA subunit